MDFVAYNRELDIDTNKVLECQDQEQLREWRVLLTAEVVRVKNRLSKMKGKYKDGEEVSHKLFEDANIYRRIQAGLLNQVVNRLTTLKNRDKEQKKVFEDLRRKGEVKFWKEKVKEIAPEKYFIFCDELEAMYDSMKVKK